MDPTKSEEYSRAKDWMKRLPARLDGVSDAEWIVEHAKAKFTEGVAAWETLESKANSLIRYLGGGGGLLAFGTAFSVSGDKSSPLLWAGPAIFMAIVGMLCAMAAISPGDYPVVDKANRAVGCARKYGDKSSSIFFIGQYHLAAVRMQTAVAYKAKWVKRATWCYVSAVILLGFPVVIALFW